MWFSYLHHISVHFPIALGLFMACVGIWALRTDEESAWVLLRLVGAFVWVSTTAALVSGLVAAQEFWTADGPDVLIHHRNLGITAWVVVSVAVGAYEMGVRENEAKLRKFAALCWIAVAISMVGAGHWGGSGMHSDRIPWQGEPPVISTPSE